MWQLLIYILYVCNVVTQVQSLTKVHHRNIVSLVGYCWEKNHLALVYEYMSQGNLYDHLRGLSSYLIQVLILFKNILCFGQDTVSNKKLCVLVFKAIYY
jgi:serine/threonine protein kinase